MPKSHSFRAHLHRRHSVCCVHIGWLIGDERGLNTASASGISALARSREASRGAPALSSPNQPRGVIYGRYVLCSMSIAAAQNCAYSARRMPHRFGWSLQLKGAEDDQPHSQAIPHLAKVPGDIRRTDAVFEPRARRPRHQPGRHPHSCLRTRPSKARVVAFRQRRTRSERDLFGLLRPASASSGSTSAPCRRQGRS